MIRGRARELMAGFAFSQPQVDDKLETYPTLNQSLKMPGLILPTFKLRRWARQNHHEIVIFAADGILGVSQPSELEESICAIRVTMSLRTFRRANDGTDLFQTISDGV
jgi:hypothetical protein